MWKRRGIGQAYAKKLLRAFGEKVFDVIEATPNRLREVNGIGPVRAASILATEFARNRARANFALMHSCIGQWLAPGHRDGGDRALTSFR